MSESERIIEINKRRIGPGYPVYIVAEIGTNYNGDISLAFKTMKAVKEAGVDAVKFQIITAERSYTKKSESHSIFKKIELRKDHWREIFDFARKLNMACFATFVNGKDLEDFSGLDWPAFKISSSNLTNFPLLKAIAAKKKPVIISTGLSYLSEIEEAVGFLEKEGQKQIAILQCTSLYPPPTKDVNLRVIQTLQEKFPKFPIGFSDHTEGIYCAVAAVAIGSCIIEKHFTLDQSLEGPDHHFSATPELLTSLVKAVREIEKALGYPFKEPVAGEVPLRDKWQRSLVALKNIQVGEILTAGNVGIKRSPKKGLEPKYYDKVLGKKVKKPLLQDEPITKNLF